MTVAVRKFTFEEYLAHDDGTNNRYELVDGELVAMGIGTGLHGAIAEFLNEQFKEAARRAGQPWTAKDMKVGIRSPRGTRWETSRIPDVVILPLAQWEALRMREAVIELHEPPPLLVVEVVSESTIATDYRAKHSEYSVVEITEYWIVDPLKQQVTVCQLRDGRYDDVVFVGNETIDSRVFLTLALTAEQVLAGRHAS